MKNIAGYKKAQSGYLLPSLGVFIVIASMTTTYYLNFYAKNQAESMWDDKARLIGGNAALVDDAVKTYATKYFTFIQRGVPITSPSGYVIPAARVLKPTLADLQAVANLNSSAVNPIRYNNQNISFNVELQVDTTGGCVIPTCNLKTLVKTSAPISNIKNTSIADVRRASLAANVASPANAGVSLPESADVFTGNGGKQLHANTPAVAGLIAIRNGYDSSGMSEFARRDGSLPMTGDLRMQDDNGVKHSIKNAKSIDAEDIRTNDFVTSTLTADEINSGSINSTNILADNLRSSTANFDNTYSRLFTSDDIYSYGRLRSGEFLKLDRESVVDTWCPESGLFSRDASGALLSCQNNAWKPAGSSGISRYGDGFIVFSNGHTQQWGITTVIPNNWSIRVNYPIPMLSTQSVTVNGIYPANVAGNNTFYVFNADGNGFGVVNDEGGGGAPMSVYWQAIGKSAP